jgi:hypothetical protein
MIEGIKGRAIMFLLVFAGITAINWQKLPVSDIPKLVIGAVILGAFWTFLPTIIMGKHGR